MDIFANVELEVADALETEYEAVRAHVAVVLFRIHPRRNLDALKLLFGNRLSGIVVSDRCCVYDDWDEESRQLCWAEDGFDDLLDAASAHALDA